MSAKEMLPLDPLVDNSDTKLEEVYEDHYATWPSALLVINRTIT